MDFGVYRSKDPVENLKIKVTLRKVTATNVSSDHQNQFESETKTLAWQQKVFSRREVEKYKHIDNHQTDAKQALRNLEYREKVLALPDVEGLDGNRIFTYVDKDDYFAEYQALTPMTISTGSQRPSFLETRVNEVRRRHGLRHPDHNIDAQRPTERYHEDNVVSNKLTNRDKARRVIDTPFQIMYIMVDLSDGSAHSDKLDDHILCTLKIDDNGVLEASSDYDKGPPYRIHTHRGTIYEFTFQHASIPMTQQDREKESQILSELHTKHTELLTNRVGDTFLKVTTPHTTVYHLFGELISACGFEYDNLYVRLLIDLPSRWRWVSEKEPEPFVSQMSRTSSTGGDDAVAKFAYPFNLELEYTHADDDDDDGDGGHEDGDKKSSHPTNVPRILFQVNSLDYFERHRTEGYGHVVLPLQSGSFSMKTQCWRPLAKPVTSNMRRYFLGGTNELDHPTYVGIPSLHDKKVLSRLGMNTISTGTVHVRVNVVKQNSASSAVGARKVGGVSSANQSHTTTQEPNEASETTTAVLSAFQRVHQLYKSKLGETPK
eukprot:m.136270 g.136270  ORF g.136270 m.136270 type:complete len:546 (+) comp29840_c0_seq2:145-1782(+)